MVEKRLSREPERFGHGAIEGVAGPEAANNASAAGVLVPLLTLGLPSSATAAIMLAAFQQYGLQPGPLLFASRPDLVWTLIWALVVGNLIAVTFLLFIMRWVVLLTFVNGAVLVPFIVVMAVVGSYVSEGQWQNLVVLVVLSAIGYGLLRFNWPRAPFVIGIVLGKIAEESLHKALELWGLRFFTRPLSLVLIGLIVLTIAYAVYRNVRPRAAKAQQPVAS